MAPLSRDLSGIIIPHDSLGSHLDSSGRTMNSELEKQNFENAGRLLASVWNENVIDGFEVISEFIPRVCEGQEDPTQPSQEWIWKHVKQSQYLLQIVKCFDKSCCSPLRSNIFDLLPDRFLPAPLLFSRGDFGLELCELTEEEDSKSFFGNLCHRLALKKMEPVSESKPILPFDQYCPSVTTKLNSRTCKSCYYYCASQTALKAHMIVHKTRPTPTVVEVTEVMYETVVLDDESFPIIDCLESWNAPIFETDWLNDDVHTPTL